MPVMNFMSWVGDVIAGTSRSVTVPVMPSPEDRGFGAAALSGNAERSRGRDHERKGQGCSQGEPEHSESFQGGSAPQIRFKREL
jgi:hypothetical protein